MNTTSLTEQTGLRVRKVAVRVFNWVDVMLVVTTLVFAIGALHQMDLRGKVAELSEANFRNKSFLSYLLATESSSPDFMQFVAKKSSELQSVSDSMIRPDTKTFLINVLVRLSDPKLSSFYQNCLSDKNYSVRLLGFIALTNTPQKVTYDQSIKYFLENVKDKFLLQVILSYYSNVPWPGQIETIEKHAIDDNEVIRSWAIKAALKSRGSS